MWRIRSRQEEDGALEHADQQQVLALVVAEISAPELAHAVPELVGLDDDLADRRVVASCARQPTRCQASRSPSRRAEALAGRDAGDPGDLAAAQVTTGSRCALARAGPCGR